MFRLNRFYLTAEFNICFLNQKSDMFLRKKVQKKNRKDGFSTNPD